MTAKDTTRVVKELSERLAIVWSKETSFDPAGWSRSNPAWGQCAVTALIVQDALGGELRHGTVEGIEHYWNRLQSGRLVDLTRHQFVKPALPRASKTTSRDYVLSFPETARRYHRLRQVLDSKTNAQSLPAWLDR